MGRKTMFDSWQLDRKPTIEDGSHGRFVGGFPASSWWCCVGGFVPFDETNEEFVQVKVDFKTNTSR